MKLLAIYAHPEGESLNLSILKSVEKGASLGNHELKVSDLYAMKFNPILSKEELNGKDMNTIVDVEREQQRIQWADILIFIYPIWWYDRPAILKGWIDRVFSFGFAYRHSSKGIEGLLTHQKALVFQTAGSGEDKFRVLGGFSAVDGAMKDGTLKYCGIQNVVMHTMYSAHAKSKIEIAQLLEEIQEMIRVL